MGTSNIYRGPGGSKKLLPDWIDENSLTEKEKENIVKEWKNVKSNCTRVLNSKNKENYKIIFPHYRLLCFIFGEGRWHPTPVQLPYIIKCLPQF